MTSPGAADSRNVTRFRWRLLAALMVIVATLSGLGLYLAQRVTIANATRELQQRFQSEVSAFHKLLELRHVALTERCRLLASKPRIHAALEDNALDLLYPSARDELRDLMQGENPSAQTPGNEKNQSVPNTGLSASAAPQDEAAAAGSIRARFYRFLDNSGAMIAPPNPNEVGVLTPEVETQLSLKKLPETPQFGYLRRDPAENEVDEITAVPIFSTETGQVISALVIGFKPFAAGNLPPRTGIQTGIWVNGRLDLPSISPPAREDLAGQLSRVIKNSEPANNNFVVRVGGARHLVFYKQINPDSVFPPAFEVSIYPLAASEARLHQLRWQIASAGGLLLLLGFAASHWVARRLAAPVEKLALDSALDRAEREHAEAALASTAEELKRSSRYSADASHQLKSPVTLLRTGLESLLTRDDFKPDVYEELSSLLHQTHRLTNVIDDLLLLSRMDAGHLQIKSDPVNLSQLVEQWLEDLEALPDAPEVKIDRNFPHDLYVAGEKQYTSLIVQNLLENARRYNRPGGRIEVSAGSSDGKISLRIGNTGRPIPQSARKHIFERFHRSSADGTGSGHGLGLNLARELTRLHGGELQLIGSDNDWTEFEVRFRAAAAPKHSSQAK